MERSAENHPNERITDQSFWARVRNWWGAGRGYRDIWLIVISVLVLIGLDSNKENSDANRDLTCDTARLVSFVPALQFEGEPRENFIGWLRARRAMLEGIREHQTCDAETERLLENRVRLDQKLLDQR
jgi:hypothetical protein